MPSVTTSELFDRFMPELTEVLGMARGPPVGNKSRPGQSGKLRGTHRDHQLCAAQRRRYASEQVRQGRRYPGRVSRSGKTPTCLYLALHYGMRAANYPITEEDFEKGDLPDELLAHKKKIFALTIEPERLAAIRELRRPNSDMLPCGAA